MKRAAAFFSAGERDQIEAAVAAAEARTSAEILPVLATASGRYDRAEDLAGLSCGMLLMTAAWYFFQHEVPGEMWIAPWRAWQLPALITAVFVGFLAGAILAMRIASLRRLFTSRQEMRDEVMKNARDAFVHCGAHKTLHATGIVVYVSLYERMAAIIADDAALQCLGQDTLDALCAQLVAGMKAKRAAAAYCEVIAAAGEKLATTLPREPSDINELPNRLILLD